MTMTPTSRGAFTCLKLNSTTCIWSSWSPLWSSSWSVSCSWSEKRVNIFTFLYHNLQDNKVWNGLCYQYCCDGFQILPILLWWVPNITYIVVMGSKYYLYCCDGFQILIGLCVLKQWLLPIPFRSIISIFSTTAQAWNTLATHMIVALSRYKMCQ